MIFQYSISTKDGEIKNGEIEANDREEIVNKFLGEDYLIVSLKEKKKNFQLGFSIEKVSDLEKIYLFKNLSLMLRAGLPIPEIMKTLVEMAKSNKLKNALRKIKEKTEKGTSVVNAFSMYPDIFSPLMLGLIRLGEQTGQLDETTDHLHSLLLSRYDFKKEVKSALIYPASVIIVAIIIFVGIFLFLLPKLTKLFSSLRVNLPPITKFFMWLLDFFNKNLFYIAAAAIIIILSYVFLLKIKKFKRAVQGIDLFLPVIGRILKNINLSYFSKNLGLLLKSGMPIERALFLNLEITENEVYRERAQEILDSVRKGNTISVSLEKAKREFPKNFTKTIESGEKSGNLMESLRYLASFYEAEVERDTKDLTIALEPMLLIFVGLIVAFLAIAIISPIYQYITALEVIR